MKKIIFCLTSFCVCHFAFAQVSGKLVNTKGESIAAANVSFLAQDSTLLKTTLTNNEGNYILADVDTGKFIIHISNAGFATKDIPVELTTNTTKDLGTIILEANTKDLQEVVIRSERPMLQLKPEGMSINVENSIFTKGSNALQVLERLPGIIINKRDNSIELNGKNGVMLNGRMVRMSESQLLDLLAGMSADDIANIELLTSPSAKYDAEGTAGLINIVLKKNKLKGTNGSVSLSTGIAYREKAMASINLSHNTAKVNINGSYSFSHNSTYSNMFVDSWQNMPFLGGSIHALGWDTTDVIHNNQNAVLGIDAILNSKISAGANFIYTSNKSTGSTYSHLFYNVLPDSVLQYDGINTGMSHWNNLVSSAYIEANFKKNEKLNMNIDYLWFSNDGPYKVNGSFTNKHGEQAGGDQVLSAPAQKGAANTIIKVIVGKADYTKTFNKDLKMEAGIKNTFTQSSSYSGFERMVNGEWKSDPQAVNNIEMKESIAAAYVSFNKTMNASTSITAGLRYEYAYTNMDDSKTGRKITTRKLGSFFPSIFFSKKIGEQNELQLNYTKRITRPSYNDLASYVGYNDPTAVVTGNPFLKPTISHNVKLGYRHGNYMFALLFSRDLNTIARYQLSESPQHDMLIISPQNIEWLNSISFQTNLPVTINQWWTMSYGFFGGLRQYQVTYSKQPFENNYFGYSFNHSQVLKLPKRFSAELSGSYSNANYNGTQKVESIVRINLGLKKELANNKGSFQLAVTDLLGKEKYNIHYGTVAPEAFDIKNYVLVNTETTVFPLIRLSFTKSFGSSKTKASRSGSSSDEQDRIRKE